MDFEKLNKAKPSKLDVLLDKNDKIAKAVQILIRTAYLNHHIETNERNEKLVMCLNDKANFLLDQLKDEQFLEKLQGNIRKYIKKDIKAPDNVVDEIEKEILSLLEKYSSSQSSDTEKTIYVEYKQKTPRKKKTNRITKKSSILSKKILNNKNIGKIVETVVQNTLMTNESLNSKRLKVLDKLFVKSITLFGKNENRIVRSSIVRQVTGGFGLLVKNFIVNKIREDRKDKSLFELITEQLTEKINNVKKRISEIKKNFINGMRRIKNGFKPQNIIKTLGRFIFSVIKGISGFVNGIIKGAIKLVGGIIKLGINIVKGMFSVMGKTIKVIFGLSKKIVSITAKLTVGFLKKIKLFLLTPTGMFVTGYIVGFIYGKLKKFLKWAKPKFDYGVDEIKDFLNETRIKILNIFTSEKSIWLLDKLERIKYNYDEFKIKMRLYGLKFNEFFSTKTAGAFVGAGIGAVIGRIIGEVVGTMFLPAQAFAPGIGTALGALAGEAIGRAFGTVRNEEDEHQRSSLVSDMMKKYSERKSIQKNVSIRDTYENIRGKLAEIDMKLERNDLSSDERESLLEEKRKKQKMLEYVEQSMTSQDENEKEKNENEKRYEKIIKWLKEENDDDVSNSIFDSRTRTIGNILEQSGGEKKNYKNENDKTDKVVVKSKKIALNKALDAYKCGQISFNDIENYANQILDNVLRKINVNLTKKTQTGTHSNGRPKYKSDTRTTNLFDYVGSIRQNDVQVDVDDDAATDVMDNEDISAHTDRFKRKINQSGADVGITLTNRYIDFIGGMYENEEIGKKVKDYLTSKRPLIQTLFQKFCRDKEIRSTSTLQNHEKDINEFIEELTKTLEIEKQYGNKDHKERESKIANLVGKVIQGGEKGGKIIKFDDDQEEKWIKTKEEALARTKIKPETESEKNLVRSRVRYEEEYEKFKQLSMKCANLKIPTSTFVVNPPKPPSSRETDPNQASGKKENDGK